tara:strand:- start:249 stop:773 length:525 start_codon:yes stop_codon:yes gene_type:complete
MAATIPTNGMGLDAGLDITGGNLTFKTADKGVHLGVTSATAANLLDDYEEGSWTAQLVGATSGTYAASTATYVKVGRVCTVNCMFTTTIGNNVEGNISLQTLPFAPDDSAYVPIAPYYVDLPADASGPMHLFLVGDNTTAIRMRYLRDGQAPVDMVGDHIANAAIYINFTYEVN